MSDDLLKALENLPPPKPPLQRGPWPAYRPSNGSEGEWFMSKFCYRCVHDDYDNEVYCEILTNSMAYNTREEGYPLEYWVYFNDEPTCMNFRERGSDNDDSPPPVDPDQLDLFLEMPVVEA